MNLGKARVVFRQRTLSETFDLALKWMVSVRGTYAWLAVVLLVPAVAACIAARFIFQWEWISVWMLAGALGLVVQAPFCIAASRLMFEPEVRTRSVLGHSLRRAPAYLTAMILSRAFVAAASTIVITGPFAWAAVAFIPEAVLLEGQGVVSGLRRASGFTRGQVPTVLGLLVGFTAALFAFVAGFDQLGFGVLDVVLQLGRPLDDLWEHGGSASALIGFFAAIPYLTTVRFLQYIDGRTRRDGWDIQLAFLSISLAEQDSREEGEAA